MLLAVDKPHGITSYDVIRKLKKHFPKKTKIGHAGTLDPYATGLMLIGVGSGTKLLHELTGQDKTYITRIDFSKDSDTRDMQYRKKYQEHKVTQNNKGIIINDKEIPAPSKQTIEEKLQILIPSATLPLTPFSAKKVDGKKLYEYARGGNPIMMDIEMIIHNVNIVSYNFPSIELEIKVGKGTYIRSIGYRLGKQFGLGGTLTSLRRTSSGEISLGGIKNREERNDLKIAKIEE